MRTAREIRRLRWPARMVMLAATAAFPAAPASPADGSFALIRSLDRRVATVAERLAIGNVTLCRATRPAFGFVLHAIDQYAPAARGAARAAFGFASAVSVAAIVPAGAAGAAGMRDDDAILAIDGTRLPSAAEAMAAPGAGTATRDQALALLARAAPGSAVRITLLRDGSVLDVTVRPVRACDSTAELTLDGGRDATADGRRIRVDAGLAARLDDDALAVVMAHELAHNILDHGGVLTAAGVRRGLAAEFGRNRRLIRRTEDEADRLSAWLLANAGMDVGAAVTFWRTQGGRLDGGWFRSRTHSGAATRARLVEGEMPALAAATVRPARPAWIDRADALP